MAKPIKADGDSWSGRVGDRSVRPGFRTIVFFCVSNGQRPYRVVEVPTDRIASQEELDRLGEDELRELLAAASSMDSPLSSG